MNMDKDLYQIMKKIREKEEENAKKYGKFKVDDVVHKGKIKTIEEVNGVNTEVEKDIFEVIEIMLEDGSIVKNYYDENINCIAGRDKDGQMYPSKNPIAKDIDLNKKIEDLAKAPGLSLNEVDKQIEAIAKELGMEKEHILAVSQYDLDQKIENREEKDEKLKIEDEEKKEEKDEEEVVEKNEKALDKINAKQEINLDKKVDDIHTLGQILGVESGSKLIAVYSNAIENNENTTRFSFIIKKSDGTIEMADMLNQAGGRDSNKNIYEINRDGSKVEEKSVQSSYTIDSPVTKNGLLTARVGDAGRIEISYGEMDRAQHKDALTHELKTDHTKDVTYEVREEFSYKKGTENIKEDIKELKETEEYGIKNKTLEDADGEVETGVLDNIENMNEEDMKNLIEKIKEENTDIGEVFTDREIENYLRKRAEENGQEESFEETIENTVEDLKEDASHFKARETR